MALNYLITKLKISYFYYILSAFSFLFSFSKAQVSPAYDQSWQIDLQGSDEFNGSTLGSLFVSVTGPWIPHWKSSNIIMDGNNLRLKFVGNSTNHSNLANSQYAYDPVNNPGLDGTDGWTSAGVFAPSYQGFSYGYYEIRAKLPGYPSAANPNVLTELGLIPQFWIRGATVDCPKIPIHPPWSPIGNCYFEEVDMMEGDGWDNRNFGINSHWWFNIHCSHKSDGDQICDCERTPSYMTEFETDQVNTYHKYGYERTIDKFVFYFDDQPYFIVMNPVINPSGNTSPWIDLDITSPHAWIQQGSVPYPNFMVESSAPIVPNPAASQIEFVVDYFHYYKRKITKCQGQFSYSINNNTDLTNYPSEVWYNINVGSTGMETVLMTSNIPQVLTFSNEFTAICDFEVPLGKELTIIAVPCH